MTLHKDQDPGWWRRGMSPRAILIVTVIAGGVVVGGLIWVAATGIPLF